MADKVVLKGCSSYDRVSVERAVAELLEPLGGRARSREKDSRSSSR